MALNLTSTPEEIAKRLEELDDSISGLSPEVAALGAAEKIKAQARAKSEYPEAMYLATTTHGNGHTEFVNDLEAMSDIIDGLNDIHENLDIVNILESVSAAARAKSPMLRMFDGLDEEIKTRDFNNVYMLAIDTPEFWDAFRELYYRAAREVIKDERLDFNEDTGRTETSPAFTRPGVRAGMERELASQLAERKQIKEDIIAGISKVKDLSEDQKADIERILDEEAFGGSVSALFDGLPADFDGGARGRSYARFQKLDSVLNNKRMASANAKLLEYLMDPLGLSLSIETIEKIKIKTGGKELKLDHAKMQHNYVTGNAVHSVNPGLQQMASLSAIQKNQKAYQETQAKAEKAADKRAKKAEKKAGGKGSGSINPGFRGYKEMFEKFMTQAGKFMDTGNSQRLLKNAFAVFKEIEAEQERRNIENATGTETNIPPLGEIRSHEETFGGVARGRAFAGAGRGPTEVTDADLLTPEDLTPNMDELNVDPDTANHDVYPPRPVTRALTNAEKEMKKKFDTEFGISAALAMVQEFALVGAKDDEKLSLKFRVGKLAAEYADSHYKNNLGMGEESQAAENIAGCEKLLAGKTGIENNLYNNFKGTSQGGHAQCIVSKQQDKAQILATFLIDPDAKNREVKTKYLQLLAEAGHDTRDLETILSAAERKEPYSEQALLDHLAAAGVSTMQHYLEVENQRAKEQAIGDLAVSHIVATEEHEKAGKEILISKLFAKTEFARQNDALMAGTMDPFAPNSIRALSDYSAELKDIENVVGNATKEFRENAVAAITSGGMFDPTDFAAAHMAHVTAHEDIVQEDASRATALGIDDAANEGFVGRTHTERKTVVAIRNIVDAARMKRALRSKVTETIGKAGGAVVGSIRNKDLGELKNFEIDREVFKKVGPNMDKILDVIPLDVLGEIEALGSDEFSSPKAQDILVRVASAMQAAEVNNKNLKEGTIFDKEPHQPVYDQFARAQRPDVIKTAKGSTIPFVKGGKLDSPDYVLGNKEIKSNEAIEAERKIFKAELREKLEPRVASGQMTEEDMERAINNIGALRPTHDTGPSHRNKVEKFFDRIVEKDEERKAKKKALQEAGERITTEDFTLDF
ncbi:MAG: hypothetical protein FWC00_02270 [Firmicutes bacterium]|nr:hypothetical protein [Bacillota bacterium]